MTEDQRIEATVGFFVSQGAVVLKNEKDTRSSPAVFRITLRQEDKKATQQIALGYLGDTVYRVVASWTDSGQDPSLTDRFIGSFKITGPQPSSTQKP